MQTVLTVIFWWFAINFAGAAIWTCYCMWPRRRDLPDSIQSAFRRAL